MAALTTLMTRFCAGEDSWLARSNNTSRNPGTSDATDISVTIMAITPKTRPSMPDSVALSPVSGKSHSKETIRARPVWTAYSTAHVKLTATPMNQLIIPTETVGSSSRPASSTPNTREGGRQVIGTTERFTSQMPWARRNFPPKIDQIRSRDSSSASVAHLMYPLKLYCALKIPWALAEA